MLSRKKRITPEEALHKMESLCSRSEQCEFDICMKLVKLGIDSENRKKIIEYLINNRYLDNGRFARSFTNDKTKFAFWGPYKIRMALALKKIPDNLISEAFKRIEQEAWENSLLKNAESKARQLDLCLPGQEGYANRKKLFSFLMSKGFSATDANRAVKIMKTKQSEET